MNERTIRITGTGKKKYQPDQIVVSINYDETFPTYEEAMQAGVTYTGIVKKKAASAGVDESSVKTSSFNVSRRTTSVKDQYGNYHDKFMGYEATIYFRIRIPVDNRLLSKLLYEFRDHQGDIRFSYTLSDREKANEEVLQIAVENATKKANALAKASGVTLGKILNIDYSFGRVDVSFTERKYCFSAPNVCGSAPEIDIDPEDLEVEDTVTIIWEIE